MKVSSNFNRFYHSLLGEFYKQADEVKVEGIGILYTKGLTLDNFKQTLKLLNLEYPRENYTTLSTKDISNKDLVEHIEFIIKLAYQNYYRLKVVEQEWEQVLRENR